MTGTRAPSRAAGEMLGGVRTAFEGLRGWTRAPSLMAIGMVPGLIVAAVLGAALAVLAWNLGVVGRAIASGLGFDDGWLGSVVAVSAAGAVMIASAVIAVALFATLVLAIGGPFFEAISRRVDEAQGGLADPAPEEHWARGLIRGLRDGLATLGISIALSLTLLLVGLVPVIGSVTAFSVGAVVGGWLLVGELTAYPMARRGILERRARLALLRRHRLRALAFGATVFLAFLLPLGALVAMPAAVVGATLLTRHVVGR